MLDASIRVLTGLPVRPSSAQQLWGAFPDPDQATAAQQTFRGPHCCLAPVLVLSPARPVATPARGSSTPATPALEAPVPLGPVHLLSPCLEGSSLPNHAPVSRTPDAVTVPNRHSGHLEPLHLTCVCSASGLVSATLLDHVLHEARGPVCVGAPLLSCVRMPRQQGLEGRGRQASPFLSLP